MTVVDPDSAANAETVDLILRSDKASMRVLAFVVCAIKMFNENSC